MESSAFRIDVIRILLGDGTNEGDARIIFSTQLNLVGYHISVKEFGLRWSKALQKSNR